MCVLEALFEIFVEMKKNMKPKENVCESLLLTSYYAALLILLINNFSKFRSSNATEVYYCRNHTEQDEGTDTETQINV